MFATLDSASDHSPDIPIPMVAVVPVRDGALPAGGVETVAECGGRGLLVGASTAAAAATLGGHGLDVGLLELGDYAPGGWAVAMAEVLRDVPRIVLPASPDGRDLAARLAAALGVELLAGAILVSDTHV